MTTPSPTSHDPAALVASLPWVHFLPEKDRQAFVEEVATTLRLDPPAERAAALTTLIEEWRAAAELWGDPSLPPSLR